MIALNMALRCVTILAVLVGNAAAKQAASPNQTREQAPAVKVERPSAPADKVQAEEAPAFKNRKEKLSYAFGVDMAMNMKWQALDVDPDLLVKAFKDAMAGNKLLMTVEDVTATLKTFEAEQKKDFDHAKFMRSERNKREGEAFFSQNAKKEGVVTLPSGLQYKVLTQGDGKRPTLDDNVVCNYRGTLLDGTEFANSYKGNQSTTLPVNRLIKGWSEAIQLMPVGSKWQLFVPPQLAYGEKIVGGIGPNAMVVFEVELVSIEDKSKTVGAARNP